ncbi:MAG: hypothetical protein MJ071_05855 [Oscillospiraceae bacterium]|nr:hypothetical protein [Oscillospiraceae bacterium]
MTRNKAAASRGGNISLGDRLNDWYYRIMDAVESPNGRLLLFAAQFLLSFVTIFYFKGVLKMAYCSMFYRLDIPEENRTAYCFLVSMVCLFYGIIMLFTRKQIITKVVIMISMPFYLPIIMFNYQHLELLIPLGILVGITYLASGTSEGPKTILGALFIMLYIIGMFVFLTVQSILLPVSEEVVVERGVTPGGQYRYSVVQVLDQADGNTYVSVEPNTADLEYKHCKWYAKGYKRQVFLERPVQNVKIEWTEQSRADITRDLIDKNPNTTFTLNATQMKLLGLDVGYGEEYAIEDLSRKQRHALGYGSSEDQLDVRMAKLLHIILVEPDYTVSLDFDKMVEIGLAPTYELRLSHMNDENLAALGVPRENEVLRVNGKIVFRQYVAEIERFFWESSRDMSAFLERNEVPEVNPEGVEIPETKPSATTTTTKTTTTETTAEETTTAA